MDPSLLIVMLFDQFGPAVPLVEPPSALWLRASAVEVYQAKAAAWQVV